MTPKRIPARAVFLDRDGTLNEDPGYLKDPSTLSLLPGVPQALARLQKAGFKLVIVSNQSGVNRGLIPIEAIPMINARINELVAPASIDLFELCFHRPDENCDCRKPKPKLLLEAARKLGLDLRQSFMIGDRLGDVQAGKNAGCRASILLTTGEGVLAQRELARMPAEKARELAPDFTATTLKQAVDWILSSSLA